MTTLFVSLIWVFFICVAGIVFLGIRVLSAGTKEDVDKGFTAPVVIGISVLTFIASALAGLFVMIALIFKALA